MAPFFHPKKEVGDWIAGDQWDTSVSLESRKRSGQSTGWRSDKAEGRVWKGEGESANKPPTGASNRMWRKIRGRRPLQGRLVHWA